MPKFYVSDGVESSVLEADNAIQACFRCIQYRFNGLPVNGFYKVSELGFDKHDDDIHDDIILSLLCVDFTTLFIIVILVVFQ